MPFVQLAVLVLFYALDLRDLCFKLVWLGPPDMFAFDAQSTSTIGIDALAPRASSFNASSLYSGEEFPPDVASPWLSFYDRCEALHAGDKVFDTFVGKNCQLGTFGSLYVASDVIFSTSVRVDSIAWASCKMLYLHRRPPICQESLVADFSRRYHLPDADVRSDEVAAINSDAEFELLRLLDMLSRAHPLSNVVCAEGFQYGGLGQYAPSLFTCASPNFFESVVVGHHAETFGRVHAGLSWLAVDKVSLLGFDFVVRQNSRLAFVLDASQMPVTITQRAQVNFSSFGHLYILMVAIDVLLFGLHVRSFCEVSSVLGVPLLGTWRGDSDGLHPDFSWTVLYRSLYRSKPVVVLTLLSGVLSWITMLPNAAISGWDIDTGGRDHAFLTSARAWMLVLALLNLSWDAAVALSEARAYALARLTYISITEVIAIVASVCFVEREIVFSIAATKHKLEAQRRWDAQAFAGHVAFFNAYNDALESAIGTPTSSLHAIYDPLVVIVFESLFAIGAALALRLVYLTRQRRAQFIANEAARVAAEIEVIESTDDLDLSPIPLVPEPVDFSSAAYSRLPLEEQLQLPIRARSLVRSSSDVEQIVANKQCLAPSVYVDAGLIVKDGRIRTRRGFANVIYPRLAVEHALLAAEAAAAEHEDAASGSPSKSSVSSAKITSIANLILATDAPGAGSAASNGGASSSSTTPPTDKAADASGGVPGRRPLADTAASSAARSMRRRKSVNEFTSIQL